MLKSNSRYKIIARWLRIKNSFVILSRPHALPISNLFKFFRQIRSVRRSLPQHALLTLFRVLVFSKVDYCNSVVAGITGHLMDRLQSILNVAARLVFSVKKSELVKPLLQISLVLSLKTILETIWLETRIWNIFCRTYTYLLKGMPVIKVGLNKNIYEHIHLINDFIMNNKHIQCKRLSLSG